MGHFSATGLDLWVEKRILGFFNRARTAKDIHHNMLKDDPNSGTGKYVIGEVVARRILNRRRALPGNRFATLKQLDTIQGLGEDKFNDLVYTFKVPAAEAFRRAMYESVIGSNWKLDHHRVVFDSERSFLAVVDDPKAFRRFIIRELAELVDNLSGEAEALALVRKQVRNSCLKTYESGHIGSYAFALWFYRFDADNWFGFEKVRKTISDYLDFMPDAENRAELRLLEGFENLGLLSAPITVRDLPIVVNYAEHTVTFWRAELHD